jgi:hypothetical protein
MKLGEGSAAERDKDVGTSARDPTLMQQGQFSEPVSVRDHSRSRRRGIDGAQPN